VLAVVQDQQHGAVPQPVGQRGEPVRSGGQQHLDGLGDAVGEHRGIGLLLQPAPGDAVRPVRGLVAGGTDRQPGLPAATRAQQGQHLPGRDRLADRGELRGPADERRQLEWDLAGVRHRPQSATPNPPIYATWQMFRARRADRIVSRTTPPGVRPRRDQK
jgi:hypothetical protein